MSDPHQVRITTRAERDLGKLPEKMAAACLECIFGPLADHPYRLGKALRNEPAGLHSARRGDYRVIYAIFPSAGVIEIEHIDRRSHVYR